MKLYIVLYRYVLIGLTKKSSLTMPDSARSVNAGFKPKPYDELNDIGSNFQRLYITSLVMGLI